MMCLARGLMDKRSDVAEIKMAVSAVFGASQVKKIF